VAAGTLISVIEEVMPRLEKHRIVLLDQLLDSTDFRAPPSEPWAFSNIVLQIFCVTAPSSLPLTGNSDSLTVRSAR
jgi:hypothetical protein